MRIMPRARCIYISLSIQNSVLRLAVCILKLNLRVTSRIRRRRPPYVITITSSRGPNGGSSALPLPSSYTAAPRRTAPGHSNLCPSYLTTLITIHSSYGCLVFKKEYVKDRCDELARSASHFLGPTDHF